MKKMSRSIFASVMLLAVIMCTSLSSASAASIEATTPEIICGTNVYLTYSVDEFQTVTRGSDVYLDIDLKAWQESENEDITLFGNVDQTTSKRIIFDLLDRNGEYITTATATIEGIFSQVHDAAAISSVSMSFSGGQASRISYSTDINGDTATVTFYYTSGVTFPIGSTGFRIKSNGNISQI